MATLDPRGGGECVLLALSAFLSFVLYFTKHKRRAGPRAALQDLPLSRALRCLRSNLLKHSFSFNFKTEFNSCSDQNVFFPYGFQSWGLNPES